MNKISANLFHGFINKELTLDFTYEIVDTGKFATIAQTNTGKLIIRQSYNLIISEGYGRASLFIGSSRLPYFTRLLQSATKTISENLCEIFPDIGKMEFEIDSRVMQRYQTEKAMSTGGLTAYPIVWVDPTDTCYPGIRIENAKGFISLPLEDAIAISTVLSTFDPNTFGLSLMRILGKID